MKNTDFTSSVDRMKHLINHGSQDSVNIKKNISETIEYKAEGPDNKWYGISREKQKYFIKESTDGKEFNYIGGIGNKSEFEYSSYNVALRNLELKFRSLNESLGTNKSFQALNPDKKGELVIEATEDMRKEIMRQREIMNGVSKIMKESNEFINKPTFKDPEGFGKITDPKKASQPFDDKAEAKLDKDMPKSTKKPEDAEPFSIDPKKPGKSEKVLIDAKFVPDNSVADKKPKGGKKITITTEQFEKLKKMMNEGYNDNLPEPEFEDEEFEIEGDFGGEEMDDELGGNFETEDEFQFVEEVEGDDDVEQIEEINWQGLKNVGGFMGNKAKDSVVTGAKNFGNKVSGAYDKAKQGVKKFGADVSQQYNKGVQNSQVAKIEQIGAKLKAELEALNTATVKAGGQPLNMKSITSTLMNKVTGNSGFDMGKYKTEEIVDNDDDLVNEIVESIMNSFGDHPVYQKPAFTTPDVNSSLIDGTEEWDDESVKKQAAYGTQLGDPAPYTDAVKDKMTPNKKAPVATSTPTETKAPVKPEADKIVKKEEKGEEKVDEKEIDDLVESIVRKLKKK